MAKPKPAEQTDGPIYMLVRSTINLQGLPRNHVATVDITLPHIQRRLQSSALVLLPVNEQPKIGYDPDTLAPVLEET